MRRLLPISVLTLFVLYLAPHVSAQEDLGFEVELITPPVAGQPITIEVTVFDVDSPEEGRLFYRSTGADGYTTAIPSQTGNVFRVEIPAEDVTIRGLEAYGEYRDDDGALRTYPPVTPADNPIPIQTFIGRAVSDVALPARTYRMVAVPAVLSIDSAVRVFSDEFGDLDPNTWRLVRWNPGLDQYQDAPDAPDSFAGGTAFWVITRNGGPYDIDSADSTPAEEQVVTLAPGCNQIGNPFAFPVEWADITGSDTEGVEPPVAFGDDGYVFDQAVLDPWVGYFVCNNSGASVALRVPPRSVTGERPTIADPASYSVRVTADAGSFVGGAATVGFAPESVAGRDRHDRTALPPVGDHVQVAVEAGTERLARSLYAPSAEGAVWDLTVEASEGVLAAGSQRVTFTLHESGARPAGFGLWVVDADNEVVLPVVDGRFDLALDRAAPRRSLRLVAGTELFARGASGTASLEPGTFGLSAGYPNPFQDEAVLRYTIPAETHVTLEVFDLLGRRVRVLAREEQEGGAHTARWDGRDASGRPVASGVYLVRLRTPAATATRRLSVLR